MDFDSLTKLVESLTHKNNIDTIDILSKKDADISEYDCIGIASGIAYGKYYPQMLEYLSQKMQKKMLPLIGFIYKTFGKHKMECMNALEESEQEIVNWVLAS